MKNTEKDYLEIAIKGKEQQLLAEHWKKVAETKIWVKSAGEEIPFEKLGNTHLGQIVQMLIRFGSETCKPALQALTEELNKRFKPEEFKPYLVRTDFDKGLLGYVGEETNLTALFGEKLYVGDVVEAYSTTSGVNYGKNFVCKDEDGYFIMGNALNTLNELKNGISHGWQFKKVKSYKKLEHQEQYDDVQAILTDASSDTSNKVPLRRPVKRV